MSNFNSIIGMSGLLTMSWNYVSAVIGVIAKLASSSWAENSLIPN